MAKKVQFTEDCKHGVHWFRAGEVVEFSSAATGAFFIALGAAESAGRDTPDIVLGASDILIDKNTVWGTGADRGKRVI